MLPSSATKSATKRNIILLQLEELDVKVFMLNTNCVCMFEVGSIEKNMFCNSGAFGIWCSKMDNERYPTM